MIFSRHLRLPRQLSLLLLATACGAPPAAAPPAVAVSASSGPAQVTVTAPSEEGLPVPVSEQDPSWGSRKAYVTLVLFSDFQCPFCSRIVPTLNALREKYGAEQLRIVWKNAPLPFHGRAIPAAEAAYGVFSLGGNDAFWKFHDKAFENQQNLTNEAFDQWAEATGVPMSRFRRGVALNTWEPKIRADLALADRLHVNGTPSAFINGRVLSGAQPTPAFIALVEEELAKALVKESSGTAREMLYAELSTANVAAHPLKADRDDDEEPEDTKTVFKVPVGTSPQQGSPTALVTIVEFSDFQCPYCKRVEEPLTQVKSTYGDKIRIVWKNEPLPFHPRAIPAAMLALEARAQKGEPGFWGVHDALYLSQPKLEDADLEAIAKASGLNVPKAMAAIKSNAHKATVDRDVDLGDDVAASGTPHFFINGRRLVGAQPFEKFQAIIDEEIVHANAVLAAGTKPAALYDALIKDGKVGPDPEVRPVVIPKDARSRGPATAPVVVEMFSDFQCPFCGRAEKTLDEVAKAYGPRVRIVWRDLPLPMHANAPLAAEAARAAGAQKGDAGFWKMHDRLFVEQANRDGLNRAALDRYAREQGLDMAKWAAALDGRTFKDAVDADAKAAAALGISGTPAFLVTTAKGSQGYYISGAQPFPKFRRVIDRVLKDGAPKAAAEATKAATAPK